MVHKVKHRTKKSKPKSCDFVIDEKKRFSGEEYGVQFKDEICMEHPYHKHVLKLRTKDDDVQDIPQTEFAYQEEDDNNKFRSKSSDDFVEDITIAEVYDEILKELENDNFEDTLEEEITVNTEYIFQDREKESIICETKDVKSKTDVVFTENRITGATSEETIIKEIKRFNCESLFEGNKAIKNDAEEVFVDRETKSIICEIKDIKNGVQFSEDRNNVATFEETLAEIENDNCDNTFENEKEIKNGAEEVFEDRETESILCETKYIKNKNDIKIPEDRNNVAISEENIKKIENSQCDRTFEIDKKIKNDAEEVFGERILTSIENDTDGVKSDNLSAPNTGERWKAVVNETISVGWLSNLNLMEDIEESSKRMASTTTSVISKSESVTSIVKSIASSIESAVNKDTAVVSKLEQVSNQSKSSTTSVKSLTESVESTSKTNLSDTVYSFDDKSHDARKFIPVRPRKSHLARDLDAYKRRHKITQGYCQQADYMEKCFNVIGNKKGPYPGSIQQYKDCIKRCTRLDLEIQRQKPLTEEDIYKDIPYIDE